MEKIFQFVERIFISESQFRDFFFCYNSYNSPTYYLLIFVLVALQKPVSCREIRVPNSSWFGYGFSQSSPTAALREQKIIDEKRAVQVNLYFNYFQVNLCALRGLQSKSGSKRSVLLS